MKLIRNLILDIRIRWHESNALWYDRKECTYLKNREWMKVQRLKAKRQ